MAQSRSTDERASGFRIGSTMMTKGVSTSRCDRVYVLRLYTSECGQQVQFYARGPTEVGKVSADLYKDASSEWQFKFLYVDIDGRIPQRILLVKPQPDLPSFSVAGG